MRRTVLFGICLGAVGLGVAALALTPLPLGRARQMGAPADSYQALACANIAGWDWLRATDARAMWEFDTTSLRGVRLDSVYLNLSALVTNGVNGGSGYDCKVRLWVSVPSGAGGYSTVTTVNPFRPQSPENSGGVGYQVYGHGGALGADLVRRAIEEGSLKVMATWNVDNVIPIERHYAVQADSVSLGYLARED